MGKFPLLYVIIFFQGFASGCSDGRSTTETDEMMLKKFRIEIGYEFITGKTLALVHRVKEAYPATRTIQLYRDKFFDLGYEKYVEHNKKYTGGEWGEFDMASDGEDFRLRRYTEYWRSIEEKKMITLLLEYYSPYQNKKVQLNTSDLRVTCQIMPLDGVGTPLRW